MTSSVDINNPEEIIKYDEMTASGARPTHAYELYGIVCHSGGMSGGHYVCYISYMTETGRQWYHISDSHFHSVDESKVLNAEAYILFYRKMEFYQEQ